MPACTQRTGRRDHTKLSAFELADELVLLVYKVTARFPRKELYGLTAHMRRAALSVPSNIVEGCARDSQADYLCFLYIAFGSLKRTSLSNTCIETFRLCAHQRCISD